MKKLLLISILFLSLTAIAQSEFGLYNMRHLPQVVYANPAFIPLAQVNISIPFLGTTYSQVSKSNFKIDGAPLSSSSHIEFNTDEFLAGLNDNNTVYRDFSLEVFHFGFTQGKNYLFFSINDKTSQRFQFPKEMSILITEVHQDVGIPNSMDIKNVELDYTNYREYAAGWSRKINNKISVGGRVKLLSGLYSSTSTTSGTFNDGVKENTISGIVDVETQTIGNASLSGINGFTDYYPVYNSKDSDNNENLISSFDLNNIGISLDFGVDYRINQKVKVAASVIDLLPFIEWSDPVNTYSVNAMPVEVSTTSWDDLITKDTNQFSDFVSSIINDSNSESSTEIHKTETPTKVMASVTYFIFPKIELTLVGQTAFTKKYQQNKLKIGIQGRFKRYLNYMVSYSIIDDRANYKNLGLGLAINIGPLQVHAIVDNIFDPLLLRNNYYSGLRFGANFTIGRDYE